MRNAILMAAVLFGAAAFADVPLVEVRVHATTNDGKPLPAYIALVAPDEPLWRPQNEAIARDGTVAFRVRPGAYRLFTGAPGHQDLIQSIVIGASREVRVPLTPDVTIRGEVIDAAGSGIAGARVTHARLVGPLPYGQLSALARKHLGPQWTTTTDRDGRWSLPGSVSGAVPLVIEAGGFAPANTQATAERAAEVTLRRGASLRVTPDRIDDDYVVSLIGDNSINWQVRAWARTAETPVLEWPSLPAGKYRIVGRFLDPRRFSTFAEIGAVALGEGEQASVSIVVPPAPPIAEDVRVLFVAGKSPRDFELLQAFATRGGTAQEVVKYALERSAGGMLVYLQTSAAPEELFLTTSANVIAAAGSETVVFDRANVVLRLKSASENLPLPSWGVARFDLCDRDARVAVAVPIARDGAAALAVPTGCRGLVLHVPPFEPLVTSLQLRAGENRDLGEQSLRAGAAAEIRVVRDPGGAAAVDAAVRAISEARRQVVIATGVADAEGKLTLRGLPPGPVILEAVDAGSGHTGTARVLLEPAKTTVVDPLSIPLPATLIVEPRLGPLFREREPKAKIRSLLIDRAEKGDVAARRSEEVGERDRIVFAGLQPGRWQVIALIEAAGTLQPVTVQEVVLGAGEERTLDTPVEPDVFDGVILSQGKGIEATVGFGEEPSPSSGIRSVRSRADGAFSIVLPGAGVYRVHAVPIDRPHERVDLGEMDLVKGRPLRLELPRGALRIRVHDDAGPVTGAAVTAVLRRNGLRGMVAEVTRGGTTGTAGEVVHEWLLAGRWLVEARDAEGVRTDQRFVDVADDRAVVELELKPAARLAGSVRDHAGAAVAGARVACAFAGQSRNAETDASGRFEILLTATPPPLLQCGVATAGGAIGAYTLSPTTSADLRLPRETGALAIPDWGARFRPNVHWLVSGDGRIFNLTWAAAKAGAPWSPLLLPAVPARSWKLVRATTVEDQLRLTTGAAGALDVVAELEIRAEKATTVHLYERTGGRP